MDNTLLIAYPKDFVSKVKCVRHLMHTLARLSIGYGAGLKDSKEYTERLIINGFMPKGTNEQQQ